MLVDPAINVQAIAGSSFQGKIASFTTTDARATFANFTALVNWGDGQSSTAAVAPNPAGGFFVLGDHTYAQPGTFTVSTTISDDQGHSVADTTTATVALPLAAHGIDFATVAGKRFAGAVTKFTDPDRTAAAGSLSALINWGDGTQTRGVVVAAGKSKRGATFKVEGSHVYAGRGRFVGSVAIVESGGAQIVVPIVAHVGASHGSSGLSRSLEKLNSGSSRVAAVLGSSHPEGPRASAKADRRVRAAVALRPVPLTNHGMAFPVTIDRKSGRVV